MWVFPIYSNPPPISAMYFHDKVKDFVASVTEIVR